MSQLVHRSSSKFCGLSVGSTENFTISRPLEHFEDHISRRLFAGSIRQSNLCPLLRFVPIPPQTCRKKVFSASSIAELAVEDQGVRCTAYSRRSCIRLLYFLMLFRMLMPCVISRVILRHSHRCVGQPLSLRTIQLGDKKCTFSTCMHTCQGQMYSYKKFSRVALVSRQTGRHPQKWRKTIEIDLNVLYNGR